METKPTACGVAEGSLPGACASMVFPYIPLQGNDPERYGQSEALAAGTLFPGLNLPFFRAVKSRLKCDNDALCELMALGFAVTEMGIYLDTHKDDREALRLFTEYAAMLKDGRARYEAMYGPLQQTGVTGKDGWNWLNDPWPWDAEGGAR